MEKLKEYSDRTRKGEGTEVVRPFNACAAENKLGRSKPSCLPPACRRNQMCAGCGSTAGQSLHSRSWLGHLSRSSISLFLWGFKAKVPDYAAAFPALC